MTPHERVITDDASAQMALDIHQSMLLGCPANDLRRPGWHIVVAHADDDPMALLFGRRDLLRLVAPAADVDGTRAGVVTVAPELRAPVSTLLRAHTPAEMLTPTGVAAVEVIVRETLGTTATLRSAHQYLCYTFAGAFQPYVGQWLEWIEPLDEAREMDPAALALLARFGRGVYVIRQGGRIVAYAGLRQQSPHVWDLLARTEAVALLGHGLGRAVVSRATRAVLAQGRLPLAAHTAGDAPAAHVAHALGYRRYGDELVYSIAT